MAALVRAVLFDLDGVLVFSKEVWFPLLNATASHFGAPPVTRQGFEQAWGQGVQADVERFFPHCTVAEVEAFYHAHFAHHMHLIAVEPEAAGVLAALHGAGIATAVVSNTPAPTARAMLAHAGLEPHQVVGGTDVGRSKPAPDMVLLALEKLGVAAPQALMVGDTPFDAQAAQAAGVRFVGYQLPGEVTLNRLGELLPLAGLAG